MRQGWRWFGPDDGVSLDTARQAGATEIVSALHDVPIGEAWTSEQVEARKKLIEETPAGRSQLTWSVVESIPVSDSIKQKGKAAKADVDGWIASLEAVGKSGIRVVCYNFMPVVDWTRTDLDHPTQTGATTMRFDEDRFAAFDIHILQRSGAASDYTDAQRERAAAAYGKMSRSDIDRLTRNIVQPLPGAVTDSLDVESFRHRIGQYREIDKSRFRSNLIGFLETVTPVAEALGVALALHPDDPPWPLFGLPRAASTAADYSAIFSAVPAKANGMCLCVGSLGALSDNDLPAIARQFSSRIKFAHLRSTTRDPEGRSFIEASHLEGDADMISVMRELCTESRKRPKAESIIFRSDHGQRMLDDLSKEVMPGYPAIGRLKGLAELRGVLLALEHSAQ